MATNYPEYRYYSCRMQYNPFNDQTFHTLSKRKEEVQANKLPALQL